MVVVRVTPEVHWHALEDDVVVGKGYALHRPDGRVFISVDAWRDDVFAHVADAMVTDLGRTVFTIVADDDVEHLGRWSALGFVDHRREDEVLIPTDPLVNGLATATTPPGYTLVPADELDAGGVAALAGHFRPDVAGHGAPDTCPVAVHDATGDLAGLVQVRRGRRVPRLGLVGVLPAHRRAGLARALLATAFAPLHAHGHPEVAAEADAADVPAQTLLAALGARRTGGAIELVRTT